MNLIFKHPHFVIMAIAFIATDLMITILMAIARRVGAVDDPTRAEYKVQKEAVPFFGGFGVFLGIIAAIAVSVDWHQFRVAGSLAEAFSAPHTRTASAILVGGLAMALLGLLDDFRPINALVKLGIVAAVTVILVKLGIVVHIAPWPVVNFFLTFMWIVGVISAFNAIDNTDGVTGITTLSIAGWTALVAWGVSAQDAQASLSYVAVTLVAAMLGFLRHNRPPARIYLGNSGSFSLGFVVAVMAISGEWASDPIRSTIAPVMLLSYPIFDISYTVFLRWRAGIVRTPIEAVIVSGRDHTAHRIRAMGAGPWGVIVVVGVLNLASGCAAYLLVRHDAEIGWFIAGAAGTLLLYGVFGWVIKDAVDLKSAEARISHRKPTASIEKA